MCEIVLPHHAPALKGFIIYKHEPVIRAVRRIIRWQLKYALDVLRQGTNDPDRTVHEVRKTLKRIRAVLRLVRTEIGEEQYKQYNIHLRDTARKIAPLRDFAVTASTLKLVAAQSGHAFRNEINTLSRELEADYIETANKLFKERNILGEVEDDILKVSELPKQLVLEHKDFRLFYGGLAQVYGRGRERLRQTLRDPSVQNFHDLRKRVKYLWHIHQILRRSWPRMFNLMSKTLEETSEKLGNEHDLAILSQYVTNRYESVQKIEEFNPLLHYIDALRETLRTDILSLAFYLYAEKPADFTRRMQKYWNISREEPVKKRRRQQ